MNRSPVICGFTAVLFAITVTTSAGLYAQAPDSMPTVDQVLDHYVQAIGGKANLEKFSSRTAKGVCDVPEWEVKGPFELYAKIPNKLMTASTFPDYGTVSRGFNGAVAWASDPDQGLRDLQGEELAQMKRAVEFHRELKIKDLYRELKLAGKQRVGDRDAFLIEAVPAEGFSDKMYFDAETGLMLRSDSQSEIPGGRMTTVTLYQDYREVDGIKLPFTIQQTNQEFGLTITFSEVKHNVPVDDAKFEKPSN